MPRFSVGKLPLHHYKSDLAHILDRYSSVIGIDLSEMRANNNLKNKVQVVNLQKLHTFE